MLRRICLSVLLVVALGACERSAPKPVSVPKSAAAPALSPQQQAEKEAKERAARAQQQVVDVANALKKKHPEMAQYISQINWVNLGEVNNPDKPSADDSRVLFEVVTPESIIYTDKDVSYILVGNLFLGEDKKVKNITLRPQAQQQLAAAKQAYADKLQKEEVSGPAAFNALPLKNGFNYVYGTGQNRIAVFEDPDCPFCQQFHQMLEKEGAALNIAVTVFPFVLESKHPNALARAKAIMCSTDPAATWKAWMLAAHDQKDLDALWSSWAPQHAPSGECPQAVVVDGWQGAGKQLGFLATPTIMFENGMTAEGALGKKELQNMFDKVAQEKAAAASANPAGLAPTAPTQDAETSMDAAAAQAIDAVGPLPQQ